MIEVDFNVESPASVKQRLTAGYRARRNFLLLELFGLIVYQTPVKTGLARGNWQISIGGRTGATLDRMDQGGHDTIATELGKLRGVSPFLDVFIENNLDYIDDLEQGSSGQAPHGIVRVVVPAFRSMYGDAE